MSESRWDVTSAPPPPLYWGDVKTILQVFFPQYFDPESPDYIDPGLLDQLLAISEEARPWCLSENRANLAQAMFTAYLISVQKESSSGETIQPVAGPITSEKEGDISVTYGATTTSTGTSKRPSSDPWDAWYRMWSICAKGSITTRFGDPCLRSSRGTTDGIALSATLRRSVAAL